MILYCGDHDEQFDTDLDTETHRLCHSTAGEPFSVTTEEEHPHRCHVCGYAWLHADDECEVYKPIVYTEATCPECYD